MLGASLRRQGFDVWRDEDGSLLMDGISGATEDVMAEAVERSCVVVICVSKEYKESANCRLEAKYAQQLFKKGRIRLAFVMMNEEYTTVSKEQSVDGEDASRVLSCRVAPLVLPLRYLFSSLLLPPT